MASTIFGTLNRISPAHITNKYSVAVKAVTAGIIAKGTNKGIKVYDDLDHLADDYDPYTTIWKKARSYFSANGEASSLAILTYSDASADDNHESSTKAEDPTNIRVAPTADGAVVTADASPAPEAEDIPLSGPALAAVKVLKKYYFSGPQFWLLETFTKDVAETVSNFVEKQNTGIFLAYSEDPKQLQSFVGNKKTYLMTLPKVDDSAVSVQDTYNNVFDSSFAGAMYGRRPHSAVKYALGDLPYVKPQDRYEFTPEDMSELEKFNISTYAYVLDNPKITSSRMAADKFHIDTILGWDWIQNQITENIVNFFTKNAKEGIPYSDVGFGAVVNSIKAAFLDSADMDIIAPERDKNGNETGKPDYSVTYLKPGQLPKTYEEKREVRGIVTKYHPMGMAEDAYIENTIVM